MSLRGKVYLFLFVLVTLLSAAFAAHGWLGDKSDPATEAAGANSENAIPVSARIAIRGPISHSLGSTANLRARREVDVVAQVAGIVTSVDAEEGDFVRSGQTLCSLDDRELQIDLELANQRLAQTKIQLEAAGIRREQTDVKLRNKRSELERNEEALAQGLLAESEVAVQRHEIEDLEHDLRAVATTVKENRFRQEELEAEIRKVKLLISQSSITAPFAGLVTERTVELGQSLRIADKVFKVGAFAPLYADVYLPEQDSYEAAPGQTATIRLGASDGRVATGEVERVSPVVDERTGTVKVTVRFQPPNGAFRPGAFVRVSIETHTHSDAVLIPKQAVIEEEGQFYVVVIDKDSTARRTNVELGYQNDADVQVRAGVREGQTVVIAGQGNLKDGDRTRVVDN